MIHPSIELLSQLLSGAMLSTLLRSALHTKPFCTNSKWETFPKIPSQAWACSPEFLGPQTQPLLPILSSSLINCCIPGRQLEEYVTQSSSNEENNCCSSDCDNNKHLHSWKCSSALPPGTTQTFLWCFHLPECGGQSQELLRGLGNTAQKQGKAEKRQRAAFGSINLFSNSSRWHVHEVHRGWESSFVSY